MQNYGSVRAGALAFGFAYLAGGILLAELIGSSADSTETFTTHFDDDLLRYGDIIGSLLLVGASIPLVCIGLTIRQELVLAQPSLRIDLIAALSLLGAAGLLASGSLLLTPPLLQSFGDLFTDPGLEPASAAALAQAGTVALLCTLLVLGAWTALVARTSRSGQRIGSWLYISGVAAAALTVLGITGAAAFPLGIWWIVFAFRWRESARKQTAPYS